MWRNRVQKTYVSLEKLREYNRYLGVANRCGYKNAKEMWDDNPVIQGSINPEDFRKSEYHEILEYQIELLKEGLIKLMEATDVKYWTEYGYVNISKTGTGEVVIIKALKRGYFRTSMEKTREEVDVMNREDLKMDKAKSSAMEDCSMWGWENGRWEESLERYGLLLKSVDKV